MWTRFARPNEGQQPGLRLEEHPATAQTLLQPSTVHPASPSVEEIEMGSFFLIFANFNSQICCDIFHWDLPYFISMSGSVPEVKGSSRRSRLLTELGSSPPSERMLLHVWGCGRQVPGWDRGAVLLELQQGAARCRVWAPGSTRIFPNSRLWFCSPRTSARWFLTSDNFDPLTVSS